MATSSITLNQPDPHLGGPATFTIVIPNSYQNRAEVDLVARQNGVVVWGSPQLSWVEAQSPGFTLGYGPDGATSQWSMAGGAASIEARVFTLRHGSDPGQTLAKTSFEAAG